MDSDKVDDDKHKDDLLDDPNQGYVMDEEGNAVPISDQGLAVAVAVQDDDFDFDDDDGPITFANEVDLDSKIPLHKRKIFWIISIFLIVAFAAIATGSTLAATKSVEENVRITSSPSVASSSAPSTARDGLGIWQRLNDNTFDVDLMMALQIDAGDEELETVMALRETPQFQAANWIVNEDARELQSDDTSLIQRYVLAILYFATQGHRWDCWLMPNGKEHFFMNRTFLDENDECEWLGVTCLDGNLYELYLAGCDLRNQVPKELSFLNRLIDLNLMDNWLTGTIPDEIGSMKELLYLSMSGNFLTGTIPESIFNMRQIDTIEFFWNELSGTISASVGNVSNAKSIFLFENFLSGTIPDSIGEMNELRVLDLNNNFFNGTLPELKNLKLEELILYNNDFSGPIPDFRILKNLEQIDFDNNFFSGTISDWFYDMQFLQELRFSNNFVSGTISTKIGQLKDLIVVDFSSNSMNGTIPDEIGELTNLLELLVRNNDFSGTIPTTFGDLTSLQKLWMHYNPRLGGAIPDNICDHTFDFNLEDFSTDCLDIYRDPIVDCECCQTCCDPFEVKCIFVVFPFDTNFTGTMTMADWFDFTNSTVDTGFETNNTIASVADMNDTDQSNNMSRFL